MATESLNPEEILYGVSAIIGLGIGAQWIAWRLHLPAILLLLLFGVLAGPVFGILNPDELFGSLLIPLVSLSVGIILFEGGLDLKLSELDKVGNIVWNLVTVGLIITWVLSSLSAYFIFDQGTPVSYTHLTLPTICSV